MKFTLLGSGCSQGVPRAGGKWGKCDPLESKNERTRASLQVESEDTSIIIDVTPDFRWQTRRQNVDQIDGVLLTHFHYDHTNGMDDLRAYYTPDEKMKVYANKETLDDITPRFSFLFVEEKNSKFKSILDPVEIDPYSTFKIGDIEGSCFEQDHVTCKSLGYRFGDFAYSVDMADLNSRSIEALKGIDTWVVDCYCYDSDMTTHANLERIKSFVDIIKPRITYITVLSYNLDYATICNDLPPHIRPAYDGLVIER